MSGLRVMDHLDQVLTATRMGPCRSSSSQAGLRTLSIRSANLAQFDGGSMSVRSSKMVPQIMWHLKERCKIRKTYRLVQCKITMNLSNRLIDFIMKPHSWCFSSLVPHQVHPCGVAPAGTINQAARSPPELQNSRGTLQAPNPNIVKSANKHGSR